MTNHDPFDPDRLADGLSDLSNLPAPDAHLSDPDFDRGLDDEPRDHDPIALDDVDDDQFDHDLDIEIDLPEQDEPDSADDDLVELTHDDADHHGDTGDPDLDAAPTAAFADGMVVLTDDTDAPPALLDVAADLWGIDIEPRDHPLLPDDAWQVHQLAVDLERAGVEAGVAHVDLEEIADRIDSGATAFLTVETPDGAVPMRIVDVQFERDVMIVATMDGSEQHSLHLDLFDDEWADTANQVLIADPPATGDEITLHTGKFIAVPVHIPLDALGPATGGQDR